MITRTQHDLKVHQSVLSIIPHLLPMVFNHCDILQDISPSFYHVQKPKAFLRPIITNLGNECIDPNISAENRQRSVQWITTELRKQTARWETDCDGYVADDGYVGSADADKHKVLSGIYIWPFYAEIFLGEAAI